MKYLGQGVSPQFKDEEIEAKRLSAPNVLSTWWWWFFIFVIFAPHGFLALTQVFHTYKNIRNLDVYRQNEIVVVLTQQFMDLCTKQITKIWKRNWNCKR